MYNLGNVWRKNKFFLTNPQNKTNWWLVRMFPDEQKKNCDNGTNWAQYLLETGYTVLPKTEMFSKEIIYPIVMVLLVLARWPGISRVILSRDIYHNPCYHRLPCFALSFDFASNVARETIYTTVEVIRATAIWTLLQKRFQGILQNGAKRWIQNLLVSINPRHEGRRTFFYFQRRFDLTVSINWLIKLDILK